MHLAAVSDGHDRHLTDHRLGHPLRTNLLGRQHVMPPWFDEVRHRLGLVRPARPAPACGPHVDLPL